MSEYTEQHDNAKNQNQFEPQARPYQNSLPLRTNSQFGVPHSQGYLPDHGSQDHTAALAAEMGGLDISEPTIRKKKNKDRHAYHSFQLNGDSVGENNRLLSPNAPAITPEMSQFPASVNTPFLPKVPLSPAEFASRKGSAADSRVSTGVQTSAQGRVDPDRIPSIPRSRDSAAQYYLNNAYPTFEHHNPPPASISFVAFDQGNASPKFARLTMNSIPSTSEALQSTALPLGLLLQPLASLQPGELDIPVLDFGDSGPPRCQRCRAYINPFMVFRSGGNKFVCNMCNYANDVPPEYFSALTPQGARLDREERPELMRGTVEFLVPKEYRSKEPVVLHWLFLIDVTQEAFNKGYLKAFCDGILTALYGNDQESVHGGPQNGIRVDSKVGLVTFDKEIHFYNLNPNLDQAQMLVIPDLDDPYVPLNEGLFVNPHEAKSNITSLLRTLPDLFSRIKNPEPALLPTLNAAFTALEKTGGKIICSLAALPTWGPGRLLLRDNSKESGADEEKKLFNTEYLAWKKVAENMAQAGIGADFFLAASGGGYLDIATIGHVAAFTGGETFYYPNFIASRDTERLILEIVHTVNRETGYQALMKVRCSTGLQASSYTGNFRDQKYGAGIQFGVIDENKAIGVMFSYDGTLDAKLDAHFQSALLYTTSNGERRVRCSNIIASVNDDAKECMKYVDQDTIYTLIAKEAASKMASSSLKEIRGALSEKNVDVLAGYRKNFSGSHPPGQLVLPEKLKEFSMYLLGLIKSRAFKAGREPSDRRVHDMRMLKAMGASELSVYLYPRLMPIHNLSPEDGFVDEHGHLRMPSAIRCSFSRIEEGGVYLMDNGQNCYLWIHAKTSQNFLVDLFGDGVNSLNVLDPYMSHLPVLTTLLNAQVRNIIEYLKTMRGSKALTVQLARQGIDAAEFEFARLLVEDRNNEAQSYVDWLVHIHRYVQLEVSEDLSWKGGDRRWFR